MKPAMKSAPMPMDNRWENDTVYTETRAEIHRGLCDTVPGDDLLYRSGPVPTAFLVENKRNITLDFGGAALILHGRIQPFIFRHCENITLENVRIVNGFGMGVFPFHCENILLDRLRLCRDEQSPGFVSNAADGVHAFACSGDFILRDSVVEGTVDDALNIHGNYDTVKSASGRTLTAFTGLEPKETTPLFLPGDRILLHRGLRWRRRLWRCSTATIRPGRP